MKLDFPAFHPLTPVPGTKIWDDAIINNWLETKNFDDFDWSSPVMPSKNLSRNEILSLMHEVTKMNMSPSWYLKGLLSPHKYKRRMYIWWLITSVKVAIAGLKDRLSPFDVTTYERLIYPKWYNK